MVYDGNGDSDLERDFRAKLTEGPVGATLLGLSVPLIREYMLIWYPGVVSRILPSKAQGGISVVEDGGRDCGAGYVDQSSRAGGPGRDHALDRGLRRGCCGRLGGRVEGIRICPHSGLRRVLGVGSLYRAELG